MKALISFLTILIPTWLLPVAATAHPHSWIDLRVEVLFDGDGAVTGLRQHWLFDEFYTAFATEGLDHDGDGLLDAEALRKLAELNLKNLADYGYFSQIRRKGEPLEYGLPEDLLSRQLEDRLSLSFTLPFKQPLAMDAEGFSYAIFDPSFYVEMLHAETEGAISMKQAPDNCRFDLRKPDPDPDVVAFASSLDKTESAGNDLGQAFAEQVTVSCGS